jgi:hypothetical protein
MSPSREFESVEGARTALNDFYWGNRFTQSKTAQYFEYPLTDWNTLVLVVSEDANRAMYWRDIRDANLLNWLVTFGEVLARAVSLRRRDKSGHLRGAPPLIIKVNR